MKLYVPFSRCFDLGDFSRLQYYPDMASSPQPNKYEGAGFLVHDNDPRIGLTSVPSISPPPPSHQQSTSTPFSMRAFPFVALGIAACLFGQALAFIPPGSVCAPSPYAASSTVGLAKTHTHLIRSTICSGMLQPRKWRVGWGRPAISIGGSEEYGGVRRDGRGRSGRNFEWVGVDPNNVACPRQITHTQFHVSPPHAHTCPLPRPCQPESQRWRRSGWTDRCCWSGLDGYRWR